VHRALLAGRADITLDGDASLIHIVMVGNSTMTQYNFSPETTGYSLVRFSSAKQADGDSFRRQDGAAVVFCHDEVVTLDRSLHEADIRKLGMSAFSGSHLIKGPIRKFLNGVETGAVKPGSLLLVGEWNRLTRQVSSDALKLAIDLMERGIGIVDLQDRALYTLARYNADVGLQLSLQLKISMAHQYSKNLQHNLNSVWQSRRAAMRDGKGKPTNASPAWLSAKDGVWLPPDPAKLAVIERIKQDRFLGLGKTAIATRLNTIDPVPSFTGKNGWHASSVESLVKNPALRGVYQPYRRDGTPDGDPIAFYPRVMSDADWWRMQWPVGGSLNNGGAPRGRKSEKVNSLLPEVVKCAVCGGGLYYAGGAYLTCGKARRGLCDNKYHHPYKRLESELLSALSLFDVSAFTQQGNPHIERIAATRAQLADLAATIAALVDNFSANTPRSVAERITRLEGEQDALRASLEVMERESYIAEAHEQQDAHAFFTGLVAGMASMPIGEERKVLRLKIAAHLRRMIETATADDTQMIFTLKGYVTGQIDLCFDRSNLVELWLTDAMTGRVMTFGRDLNGGLPGAFADFVKPLAA
jgi:DNA invertase Pin-like site-specific DNA recombinase